jgi:hypothetical protein
LGFIFRLCLTLLLLIGNILLIDYSGCLFCGLGKGDQKTGGIPHCYAKTTSPPSFSRIKTCGIIEGCLNEVKGEYEIRLYAIIRYLINRMQSYCGIRKLSMSHINTPML